MSFNELFGSIPDGWRSCTLGELVKEFNGSIQTGPFGSQLHAADYVEDGIPSIMPKNIRIDGVDDSDIARVSPEDIERLSKYKVQTGDIVYSRRGDVEKCSLITEKENGWLCGTGCLRVRLQTEEVSPEFLHAYLCHPAVREWIVRHAVGATMPNLNTSILSALPVLVPTSDSMAAITSNWNAISSKLVINSKTNQTLEQMAQAIFKSWFIDFDPVKAKMNGEQPEGMDAATASLFPEKLDSETGIPVGWSQGIIADIAKLNAKSWTKKNQPEQVHYVDLANTKNGVIETVTTYDFEEAPSRARRVLNSGDTIVGTVRPGNRSFAFIGETEQPLTGSTGFAVLSPKKEFWTSFVYLATTNDDAIDEYARLADGGAYPAIKPVVIADTPCVIPTKDIAQKFWQLTGVMLKKAHQNRLENEELAKLRDALLPKLLSGELTID